MDDVFRTSMRDEAAYLMRHMPADYLGEEVEDGSRYPTVHFCFSNAMVAAQLMAMYPYSIERQYFDLYQKVTSITKGHNPPPPRRQA